jgi:uncharacterized protein (TIGR02058 family)
MVFRGEAGLPDWRRYLLEVGVGIDLHGEDVTKAAQRAVKDAISHSSMIGLREILRIRDKKDLDEALLVDVTVATPYPEHVDEEAVLSILPEGMMRLTVVEGGIRFPTPQNTDLTGVHGVVLANAVIVVMFDAERSRLVSPSSA